jgi:hypothetical protein
MKSNIIKIALFSILALASVAETPVFAEDGVKFGGTLRGIYSYKDYSESSKDTVGDLSFDMAAIKMNGTIDNWGISSEYRFYDGWNALRYGYVYYNLNDKFQLQMGVTGVPFGNPGFISNSMWFGLPYYVGFEDDYDLGAKSILKTDNSTLELAFFKNGEYGSNRTDQYSVDIVNATINGTSYSNKETNQVNIRQVFNFGDKQFGANIGYSAEFGQIYNRHSAANLGINYLIESTE